MTRTHVIIKHAHEPALELLTRMIEQDKIKLPKQTEFGLKQSLTEDTSPPDQIQSKLVQPCELQPLLHKLTYNTLMTTHKREKSPRGPIYSKKYGGGWLDSLGSGILVGKIYFRIPQKYGFEQKLGGS